MVMRHLHRAFFAAGLLVTALSASAYSQLVVFGDSLSDSGNNALLLSTNSTQVITGDTYYARQPFASGTYSNGPVWTQYLAAGLGLPLMPSLAGGGNYAFGGAQTSTNGNDVPQIPGFPFSMASQVGMHFNITGGVADANALYVVAGGGNNIRAALEAVLGGADPQATFAATVAGYAADTAGMVGSLRQAGAQHVLVLNTPNFGLTPLANALGVSGTASGLAFSMNQALGGALAGSGATVFDLFGYQTGVVQQGAASGFSNLVNACGAPSNACADPATALYYDAIHPTALGHQRLAAEVLATSVTAVPEPTTVVLMGLGLGLLAWRRRQVG